MLIRGDITTIIGIHNSGKTIFAKYLASTIDKNYIYIDFIHTSYNDLDIIYNNNKDKECVILFDNFIELTTNMRRMSLFIENKKMTLLFVLNYVSHYFIKKSDIIYFAKNLNYIDVYYDSIKSYYNDKIEFENNMKNLRDYGFLSIDKDNKINHKEELIKIIEYQN